LTVDGWTVERKDVRPFGVQRSAFSFQRKAAFSFQRKAAFSVKRLYVFSFALYAFNLFLQA